MGLNLVKVSCTYLMSDFLAPEQSESVKQANIRLIILIPSSMTSIKNAHLVQESTKMFKTLSTRSGSGKPQSKSAKQSRRIPNISSLSRSCIRSNDNPENSKVGRIRLPQ